MTKDNTSENEDCLLAIAIQQHNQQALGRLYDKYAPQLMGLITRIAATQIEAEEILQETFLHVWDKISSFDASKGSFFTWLLTIARQLALVKANSAQVKNHVYFNAVYSAANSNDKEQPPETAVEKFIFELVFYKGLSCSVAATVMKMPVEEIKKNIRLAIKNINVIKVL